MKTNTILIGLGILAVAGVGFYFYNKNKKSAPKKGDKPTPPAPNVRTSGDTEEPKSNYVYGQTLGNDGSCYCYGNIWSNGCCGKKPKRYSLKSLLDL